AHHRLLSTKQIESSKHQQNDADYVEQLTPETRPEQHKNSPVASSATNAAPLSNKARRSSRKPPTRSVAAARASRHWRCCGDSGN
ncbi:MAG: hypothetical protein ABSB69_20135, partial [Solirubrobacteraceae bacterium]